MERWEAILTRYGAVTVIALFLVWWLTTGVSGSLSTIQQTLHDHVTETAFYLHAICLNGAHTDGERANCIYPADGR